SRPTGGRSACRARPARGRSSRSGCRPPAEGPLRTQGPTKGRRDEEGDGGRPARGDRTRLERAMDQQIRVLVIDDDEPLAEAVAESRERVGYECAVATSGRDGLGQSEEQTFDIVITDLMMEGVGGLEVLAKAKRELPDAEVVILTGHSTVKTAVTAMQAGATTYLTKPLDINELRTAADKASQSQRLQPSNIQLRKQLHQRDGV